MPRGVYERKSAQLAAPEQSGVGSVLAETPAKKKRIRNRKPAHKSAVKPAPAPEQPPVTLVSAELLGTPDFSFKNKRVSIEALTGAELKAYAKFIGVALRDIENLTEERLRVNCKVRVSQNMED